MRLVSVAYLLARWFRVMPIGFSRLINIKSSNTILDSDIPDHNNSRRCCNQKSMAIASSSLAAVDGLLVGHESNEAGQAMDKMIKHLVSHSFIPRGRPWEEFLVHECVEYVLVLEPPGHDLQASRRVRSCDIRARWSWKIWN